MTHHLVEKLAVRMQVFDAILNDSLQYLHTLWTVNDVTRKDPLKIIKKTPRGRYISFGYFQGISLEKTWSPYKRFFYNDIIDSLQRTYQTRKIKYVAWNRIKFNFVK